MEVLQLFSNELVRWPHAQSITGLFKWRQFEPEVILLAGGRLVLALLAFLPRRGGAAGRAGRARRSRHGVGSVQRYTPEMERRLRSRLKPTTDSWRLDETYIRIKGKWRYLYRAVDSNGATLDFLLSAKQDAAAAKRFQSQSLGSTEPSHAAGHRHRWACGLPACDHSVQE